MKCCWLMKGHQLKQAAVRVTRRPKVGMLNVQQKTLPGERLWELGCRNLHAVQLPQHQVLRGLIGSCCLMKDHQLQLAVRKGSRRHTPESPQPAHTTVKATPGGRQARSAASPVLPRARVV